MKLSQRQINVVANKIRNEINAAINERNKIASEEYEKSDIAILINHKMDELKEILIPQLSYLSEDRLRNVVSQIEYAKRQLHSMCEVSKDMVWGYPTDIEEDLVIMSITDNDFDLDKLIEKYKEKYL